MSDTDLISDPLLGSVPVHEGHKVLGGVALYAKLGQGGMGAVFRGRHLRLHTDVALKVMVPPAGLPPQHAEIFIERFLREARVTAALDHQNIIRVIDVNSESGVYFLTMQ